MLQEGITATILVAFDRPLSQGRPFPESRGVYFGSFWGSFFHFLKK